MTEKTAETRAEPTQKRSFLRRFLAVRFADVAVVVFCCVLAGLLLALFNVDPATLWVDFFGAVGEAWSQFFETIWSALRWSLQYFLLGAVLVVPIWLVWRLARSIADR